MRTEPSSQSCESSESQTMDDHMPQPRISRLIINGRTWERCGYYWHAPAMEAIKIQEEIRYHILSNGRILRIHRTVYMLR